jgi:hypothetical protein
MSAPKRRQTERLIGFGILVGADADERPLEQPHDGCHHLLAGVTGTGDVALDSLADFLNHSAEREHALEFRPVTMAAKPGVISVLLSATAIAGRHLQMTVLVGADPDVRPRRGNHQQTEPFEHGGRADYAALGVYILEPAAVPMPSNSRHRIGNVAQTRRKG